jgi:hypothetical protein
MYTARDPEFAPRRLAVWVVDVAIPKLISDHAVAPLRRWLRRVDDRLERAARRLACREVSRAPAAHNRGTR